MLTGIDIQAVALRLAFQLLLSLPITQLDLQHPGARRRSRRLSWLATVDPNVDAVRWLAAGERAGLAVRAVAGGTRSFKNAADHHELLHDAITEDGHFDLIMQLDPAFNNLFYDTPYTASCAGENPPL